MRTYRSVCFIVLAVLFSQLVSAAPPAEEVRKVAPYTRLIIQGPFKVRLAKGDAPTVRILAEQAQLGNVMTQNREDYLEIVFKDKPSIFKEANVELEVTYQQLSAIELKGGAEVEAAGALTDDVLNVQQAGSSKLFLKTPQQLKQVNLTASGASTFSFAGRAEQLTFVLSGASEATGEQLDVSMLNIKNSGASKATLSGKAAKADITLSGASGLKAENCVVETMNLKASAGSSANVHVKETLDVEASSGARVRHTGNPKQINPKVSSGGSFKPLGDGKD